MRLYRVFNEINFSSAFLSFFNSNDAEDFFKTCDKYNTVFKNMQYKQYAKFFQNMQQI